MSVKFSENQSGIVNEMLLMDCESNEDSQFFLDLKDISQARQWVDSHSIELARISHLYHVVNHLQHIDKVVRYLYLLLPSAAHDILLNVEKAIQQIRETLPANWNDLPIEMTKPLTLTAERIHHSYLVVSKRTLQQLHQHSDLLHWLRSFQDDRDFKASIEMALGKTENECPFELWVNGRVDEEILSMLSAVRRYFYPVLYREHDKLTDPRYLLRPILDMRVEPENIDLMLERLTSLLESLISLVDAVGDAGTAQLVRLIHPKSNAAWVIVQETGLSQCVYLQFTLSTRNELNRIEKLVYYRRSMVELEDLHARLLLTTEGRTTQAQAAVDSFVEQFAWIKALSNTASALCKYGHLQYTSYLFHFPMSHDSKMIMHTSRLCAQQLDDWCFGVEDLRNEFVILSLHKPQTIWHLLHKLNNAAVPTIESANSNYDNKDDLSGSKSTKTDSYNPETNHCIAELDRVILPILMMWNPDLVKDPFFINEVRTSMLKEFKQHLGELAESLVSNPLRRTSYGFMPLDSTSTDDEIVIFSHVVYNKLNIGGEGSTSSRNSLDSSRFSCSDVKNSTKQSTSMVLNNLRNMASILTQHVCMYPTRWRSINSSVSSLSQKVENNMNASDSYSLQTNVSGYDVSLGELELSDDFIQNADASNPGPNYIMANSTVKCHEKQQNTDISVLRHSFDADGMQNFPIEQAYSTGVNLVCVESYQDAVDIALSAFFVREQMPEYTSILFCRPHTSTQELIHFLGRWHLNTCFQPVVQNSQQESTGSDSNDESHFVKLRLFCLIVFNASSKLQHTAAQQILDLSKRALAPLLVVSGPDSTHYIANQLAFARRSPIRLSLSCLQSLLRPFLGDSTAGISVVCSEFSGSGKSHWIREDAHHADRTLYHVPITSAQHLQHQLLGTLQHLPHTILLDPESFVKPTHKRSGGIGNNIASHGCDAIHFDVCLSADQLEELDSLLFSFLLLDIVTHKSTATFWKSGTTRVYVELPALFFLQKCRTLRLLQLKLINWSPNQFRADAHYLQVGMQHLFARNVDSKDSNQERYSWTINAHSRIQFVAYVLENLFGNAFEKIDLAPTPPFFAIEGKPDIPGEQCWKLLQLVLLEAQESYQSLWSVWNIINILSLQLGQLLVIGHVLTGSNPESRPFVAAKLTQLLFDVALQLGARQSIPSQVRQEGAVAELRCEEPLPRGSLFQTERINGLRCYKHTLEDLYFFWW